MFCYQAFKESIHEITIFRDNLKKHNNCIEKVQNKSALEDYGLGSKTHSNKWTVFVDKIYQSLDNFARTVTNQTQHRVVQILMQPLEGSSTTALALVVQSTVVCCWVLVSWLL